MYLRLCRCNKYLLWVNFKNRCYNKTSQSSSHKACQHRIINWKRLSKTNPNSLNPQLPKETNATNLALSQTIKILLPMKVQRKIKPNQIAHNAAHPQRTTISISRIHRQTKRIQRLKTKMIRQKKRGANITTMHIHFRSWKVWIGWVAHTRRMKHKFQYGSQHQKSKSFNSNFKRNVR